MAGALAIVAGSEVSIARLRDASPKPRPELAEAFAAAGDTAAQVLLIPTEDNRRVLEQMLPKLPAELGGASTQPIARGLTYLAVGIDGPPKLSLRFLAQARDARAADDIKALLTGLLDAMAKRPDFIKLFPDQAGLRKLLDFKVKLRAASRWSSTAGNCSSSSKRRSNKLAVPRSAFNR